MRPTLASFTVAVFCSLGFLSSSAWAVVVNATFNAATDVPVTAAVYTAVGNTVNFTLGFVPNTGTGLTVEKNTALAGKTVVSIAALGAKSTSRTKPKIR